MARRAVDSIETRRPQPLASHSISRMSCLTAPRCLVLNQPPELMVDATPGKARKDAQLRPGVGMTLPAHQLAVELFLIRHHVDVISKLAAVVLP